MVKLKRDKDNPHITITYPDCEYFNIDVKDGEIILRIKPTLFIDEDELKVIEVYKKI